MEGKWEAVDGGGVEVSALHPEVIKEAFTRIANSIRSGVFNCGDCVDDPHPGDGDLRDSSPPPLMEEFPASTPCSVGERDVSEEACGGSKGVGIGNRDGDGSSDRVVGVEVPNKENGKACVDGSLDGLEIGRNGNLERVEEEEDDEDQPILAEVCV